MVWICDNNDGVGDGDGKISSDGGGDDSSISGVCNSGGNVKELNNSGRY